MRDKRFRVASAPVLSVVVAGVLLLVTSLARSALFIDPQNVTGIAIYATAPALQAALAANEINFNVTAPPTITALLAAVDFSVQRDCSGMGSLTNAIVYLRFQDGAIEAYEMFSTWHHFSKLGMRGHCYYVPTEGHSLFETNAQ